MLARDRGEQLSDAFLYFVTQDEIVPGQPRCYQFGDVTKAMDQTRSHRFNEIIKTK